MRAPSVFVQIYTFCPTFGQKPHSITVVGTPEGGPPQMIHIEEIPLV